MEIEDKYFKLLNLLIHDKRNDMNGIISRLSIEQYITGLCISYNAYMSKIYSERTIFIEDIEKGNVVFLLPFGVKYMEKEMEKEMEKVAEMHEKAIKQFFGDNFREDMIMRISEEERQKQIKEWEKLTLGLENWDNVLKKAVIQCKVQEKL